MGRARADRRSCMQSGKENTDRRETLAEKSRTSLPTVAVFWAIYYSVLSKLWEALSFLFSVRKICNFQDKQILTLPTTFINVVFFKTDFKKPKSRLQICPKNLNYLGNYQCQNKSEATLQIANFMLHNSFLWYFFRKFVIKAPLAKNAML